MAVINLVFSLSIFLTFILIILVYKSTAAPNFLTNLCSNSSTYAVNSSYPNHLDTVLRSLTSNAIANPTGFYSMEAGNSPSNTVHGLFMCRGDQDMKSCNECVATAVKDRAQTSSCPRSKSEIMLYDECMVRYDNQSFERRVDENPNYSLFQQMEEGFQFEEFLGNLVNSLVAKAANSKLKYGKKYAVTAGNFSSIRKLYVLEQCLPLLTPSNCSRCLGVAINQLQIRTGGRVVLPSCNVRYEIYPFFNGADNLTSTIPPPNSTSPTPGTLPIGKQGVSAKVITAVFAPVTAILTALLIISICFRNDKAKKYYAIQNDAKLAAVEFLQFDMPTLQYATNDFLEENMLGVGGFGAVYKGTLPNGQEIAVKRLSKGSRQGAQEFKNEVLLIAMLQHKNLVTLLGFCLDGEEKLLVYEYVPNKSLDKFLDDPEKRKQLDWKMRYNIIRGIARGMVYLHEDSRHRIIHRDLKASNILLDGNLNPKVSDFGLARIFGVDETHVSTSKIAGTYGYMAPEYALLGKFSFKSDAYSFGILVLEIISGNRNINLCWSDCGYDLLSNAWRHWINGKLLEFVDPCIRDGCSIAEVKRCVNLGLLCVQEKVDERPTMGSIVLLLDSYSSTIQVPKKPVFFISTETETETETQPSSATETYDSRNQVSCQLRDEDLIEEYHPTETQ